jgi:hypothetical protein
MIRSLSLELGEALLQAQELLVVSGLDELVDEGGRRGEADGEPLLAGGECEAERDVGLAGTAGAKGDDVFTALDVVATGEFQDEGLVEGGDGREIEAVEAFDGGKARRLDAPLDHAALAVDELQLGQTQQIADVIRPLAGAKPSLLVVLAQEARQLEFLEVMGEQDLRRLAHGPAPDSKTI